MKTNKSKIKTIEMDEASTFVIDGIGTDIIKGAFAGLFAMIVGIIGAWSLSCLVAGIIAAGGLTAFVSNWLRAVVG